MRKTIFFILLFLILSAPVVGLCAEVIITTEKDQTAVQVTVYNSNIGLIKDQRNITLVKDIQELHFMDVAANIIPTSVSIRCIDEENCIEVWEQNYEYDLINPSKLLDKYIGKEVRLFSKNYHTGQEEIITAEVLANNGGSPVFRIGGEITFNHPGRIIFPEMPKDLISKPTLVWLLKSQRQGKREIESAYLTSNITWHANYVLKINERDDRADLTGWVTIENNSGATYRNANLKLVAGDVQRIQTTGYRKDSSEMLRASAPAMPQMQEQDFFEYHIYTLGRKTTLKNNQNKQIVMIETQNIPLTKEYIYQGANPYYFTSRYADRLTNTKVEVMVGLQNKRDHNLGVPLPKGIVRVYKYDQDRSDRSLQFIGENHIDHTPKNERISLKVGNAFDIAASRKQTEWTKIANNLYESSYEISLRNQKKEDITVKVVERIPGSWKILKSSHEYIKQDSSTVHFMIPVERDKESKLTYSVRVEH